MRTSTHNRVIPRDAMADRVHRIACPRCAAVNCERHSAGSLTSRDVLAYGRGVVS